MIGLELQVGKCSNAKFGKFINLLELPIESPSKDIILKNIINDAIIKLTKDNIRLVIFIFLAIHIRNISINSKKIYRFSLANTITAELIMNEYQLNESLFHKLSTNYIPGLSNANVIKLLKNDFLIYLENTPKRINIQKIYDSGETLVVKDFENELIGDEVVESLLKNIRKNTKKGLLYLFICGNNFDSKLQTTKHNLKHDNTLIFFLKKGPDNQVELM